MITTTYPTHTFESAPEASKPLLEELKANVGMVPNLAATMAESPALLKGFLAVREIYRRTSFSPAELEVLSLTAAYENDCSWCMSFHSMMAEKSGVSGKSVAHLREGRAPVEPRLKALSDFARAMVDKRGAVSEADVRQFIAAGYTRVHALEVVLGMAFSLLANYAAHVTGPPLDKSLEPYAWEK